MNTIQAPHLLGFGSYALPNERSFAQMQASAKAQKIFFALFYSALTVLSLVIIPISLFIGAAATVGFSYLAIRSIVSAIGIFYRSPSTQNLFPKEVEAALPQLGEVSNKLCSGFATRNGVESHEWKLNLIRAAKHTIFISGCYCGGKAFNETLDLIQERMELLPELKTSILSSDMFLTPENKKRIEEMEKEFGDRFACTETPEVFPYLSPITDAASLTTQHTKALVIDYGAAFMVGGSGMLTPWSEQRGEKTPVQAESQGIFYDNFLGMKAFRDMDFVFQAPELNGVGTRLYVEMTKLFERFQTKTSKPPFTAWAPFVEPIEMPRQINQLKLACYASGPEGSTPPFFNEMIEQVQGAKESIVIGHMYFHPPKKLLQALIDASNRGVRITLVTNKLGSQSPGSHALYAELSRYYAKALFEGREKPNIELFEYSIPHTTYHKKVVIIDKKTTLLGSANIGKKSLDGSDYEINLKAESTEFAEETAQSIEEDKQFCKRDASPHISLKTRIYATFQALFTPFL